MAGNYIDVSDQDFAEKVLEVQQMVLVNFSADHSLTNRCVEAMCSATVV